MRHKWDYSVYGRKTSDMLILGRRVCTVCGEEHTKHNVQSWMKVIGYNWSGDGRSSCPGQKTKTRTA